MASTSQPLPTTHNPGVPSTIPAAPRPAKQKRPTKTQEIQALQDEIERLRAEAEAAKAAASAAQAAAAAAASAAASSMSAQSAGGGAIEPIHKPKGEAGNGFCLVEVMRLDGTEENLEMFRSIKRSVRAFAIKAGIDFTKDYRKVETERLLMVFKAVRHAHPYMSTDRFPNDWATGEILKQYLKNYRRYAVKRGRMPRRKDRLSAASSSSGSSSPPRPLRNIDEESADEE
ncbi:hypothetical protein CPC08DRAFT_719872 [Agrocybe pediades]|nr:hypothetical protein CPC08DRAFT_719872 [Agrocybe pediades]